MGVNTTMGRLEPVKWSRGGVGGDTIYQDCNAEINLLVDFLEDVEDNGNFAFPLQAVDQAGVG